MAYKSHAQQWPDMEMDMNAWILQMFWTVKKMSLIRVQMDFIAQAIIVNNKLAYLSPLCGYKLSEGWEDQHSNWNWIKRFIGISSACKTNWPSYNKEMWPIL